LYLEIAATIRVISSRANGSVEQSVNFGGLSSAAGLAVIHFRFSAKSKKDLSLSSFFALVLGPSFHVERNRLRFCDVEFIDELKAVVTSECFKPAPKQFVFPDCGIVEATRFNISKSTRSS
jgi:hypothetical protein